MNTKRLCTDEDLQDPNSGDCVLTDGQRIHIPLRLMDSAPCGCSGSPMQDSASPMHARWLADNAAANRRTIEAAQHNADRVQAFSDHYRETAEQRRRAIEADPVASAYAAMCKNLKMEHAR